MNKKTVIRLMLLVAFTRENVVQNTPTASQLGQKHQRIELEYKQMFNPNNPASKTKKGAMFNSADIDQGMRCVDREREQMFDPGDPTIKNAVNVSPNVPAPECAGVDVEVLAKQYEQKVRAHKMGDLMIFTSFTMLAESLKRAVSQANRAGASMVLRDFKNDLLKDMALTIKELGEQGGNVLMNPSALTKYKVKAVSTIVLAKTVTIDQVDDEGCALLDNFVAAAGDALPGYALDEIVRRTSQFETVVSRYLRRIRENQ